ncbi:MAG: hypothetical protein HYX26_08260 [Acidobacteriales bacterium]|nr:hypothetical protein [Terriglobales bacterium]
MPRLVIALCALLLLAGCRSRVIVVSTTNTGPSAIHNLEVQYPGGSYGIPVLGPGRTHEYRIKPFRPGDLLVNYLDATGTANKHIGPALKKNDEGRITLMISDKDFKWTASITNE